MKTVLAERKLHIAHKALDFALKIGCSSTIPQITRAITERLGIKTVPYSFLEQPELCRITELYQGSLPGGFYMLMEENGRQILVLFYNSFLGEREQLAAIAHEAGHAVLGHTQQDPLAEEEADIFAQNMISVLLEPKKQTEKDTVKDSHTKLAVTAALVFAAAGIAFAVYLHKKNKEAAS